MANAQSAPQELRASKGIGFALRVRRASTAAAPKVRPVNLVPRVNTAMAQDSRIVRCAKLDNFQITERISTDQRVAWSVLQDITQQKDLQGAQVAQLVISPTLLPGQQLARRQVLGTMLGQLMRIPSLIYSSTGVQLEATLQHLDRHIAHHVHPIRQHMILGAPVYWIVSRVHTELIQTHMLAPK